MKSMTFEEYREKAHEIINEIRDICATVVLHKDDDPEEVLWKTIDRIEAAADYPEDV